MPDAAFWEQSYQAHATPWDLGGPTPVFARLIREQAVPKGRLLIPGAGRGYDALAFVEAGFEVTAIDLSETACQQLREAATKRGVTLDVRQGDFFALQAAGCFDAVLEYTFYCAIAPEQRAAYRDQMARLLRPGGLLVGLFFPLNAPRPNEGPPYGVDVEAIKASFSSRFELLQEAWPPDSIKPRRGNEVLMFWRRQ